MTKKNLTDKQKVTAHSALLKEVGRKYLQGTKRMRSR